MAQINKLYAHPRNDKGELVPQYDETPEEQAKTRQIKAEMAGLPDDALRKIEEAEYREFAATLEKMDDPDEIEAWKAEKRKEFARRRAKYRR